VALAAALGFGSSCLAGEKAQAQQKGGGEGLVEHLQDLQLSDAQEAKIEEIRKEFQPKIKEAAKALGGIVKEEVQKISAVLSADQKVKVKEMKDERKELKLAGLCVKLAHLRELDLTDAEVAKIGEIHKDCHSKVVKAMKELSGLLTDEQKQARADALKAGKNRKEVWAAVKLTADQKQKVMDVCKEVRSLVHDELQQMKKLLTEEQKAKLQDFKDERKELVRDRMCHMIANGKELNLTDTQKSQIAAIRKEYRPKVQEAGNELRSLIREEVAMIVAAMKG
jgi:Spy/CpxP family protein refolding chaperone